MRIDPGNAETTKIPLEITNNGFVAKGLLLRFSPKFVTTCGTDFSDGPNRFIRRFGPKIIVPDDFSRQIGPGYVDELHGSNLRQTTPWQTKPGEAFFCNTPNTHNKSGLGKTV